MAVDIYVRSTDGLDTDDGSTWALAKATLSGAAAADAAGDRIFLSQVHAESSAAAQTIVIAGTITSPSQILCGNDAAQPPTALATTATISTTGASDINLLGHFYAYGITFIAGSGASAAIFRLGNTQGDSQIYESCSFQLGGTSSGNRIYAVNASGATTPRIKWFDCTVKFAHVSQRVSANGGIFEWHGGSLLSGGSAITALMDSGVASAVIARISKLDLTNLPTTSAIFSIANCGEFVIRDSKLPASWTGSLVTGTKTAVFRAEMYNCDSGDTNYVTWIEDGYGTIKDFSTLYLAGTDGIKHNGAAVPLSYKMTGNANTGYPLGVLDGMWMTSVNETTTSQTATLEIIHNESAALTEHDVWLTVEYPNTAGSTQFARLSDATTGVLDASPPSQATSTAAWDTGLTARGNLTAYSVGNLIKVASNSGRAFICTVAGTTGATEPAGYAAAVDGDSIVDTTATFKAMRRQKLAVTFTAAEQGVIRMRPVLAKTSAVVWVASKISVA